MQNNCLLCGCGWLNHQLIRPLHNEKIAICGTSRDRQKVTNLVSQGVNAQLFSLGQAFPFEKIPVNNSTTIILSIPPGRRNPDITIFESGMRKLIAQFASHSAAHVIFISTTSVYGEKINGPITEETPVSPQTASAFAHVNLEKTVSDSLPNKHTILRLAGLVGPNRHPINVLAGRQLDSPNKLVNLVHSADVVTALMTLIRQGPQNETLHLSANDNPQRRDYYQYCAKMLGLAIPQFPANAESLPNIGKQIDASKTLHKLNMSLGYPSPYDMLQNVLREG